LRLPPPPPKTTLEDPRRCRSRQRPRSQEGWALALLPTSGLLGRYQGTGEEGEARPRPTRQERQAGQFQRIEPRNSLLCEIYETKKSCSSRGVRLPALLSTTAYELFSFLTKLYLHRSIRCKAISSSSSSSSSTSQLRFI
jgi:hypothetical protein